MPCPLILLYHRNTQPSIQKRGNTLFSSLYAGTDGHLDLNTKREKTKGQLSVKGFLNTCLDTASNDTKLKVGTNVL
jgi:hypothetical protein